MEAPLEERPLQEYQQHQSRQRHPADSSPRTVFVQQKLSRRNSQHQQETGQGDEAQRVEVVERQRRWNWRHQQPEDDVTPPGIPPVTPHHN